MNWQEPAKQLQRGISVLPGTTHTDVAYMAIIPIFLATLPWEVAMRVCDVIV
jgi:hypothetical protein